MTITEQIVKIFEERGNEIYAGEEVTQLQHATQCAKLARQSNAPDYLVVAALLHDLGHIAGSNELPESCRENLDDAHEAFGYEFLKDFFGENVLAPIRLHVAAKRYLCTESADYRAKLSPVSLKSLVDQGGMMSQKELEDFRSNPHFEDAVRLRQWDDQAKDPEAPREMIQDYLPIIEKVLAASSPSAV